MLAKKSDDDYDLEWKDDGGGTGGLETVAVKAPLKGDGTDPKPINIPEGSLTADLLAAGVIPDVSQIEKNKEAIKAEAGQRHADDEQLGTRIDNETTNRENADSALAARIDKADLKIAEQGVHLLPDSPPVGQRNDKVLKYHDDTLGWEVDSEGNPFVPTQTNLYPSVSAMIEAADQTATVDPVVGTDDAAQHLIKLGVPREIIGTDWVNLPRGFGFRIGHVVPRSGVWFICGVAHTKNGVGPDNDPDHWAVLTGFKGTWASGWFGPGEVTLHSDNLYYSTTTITSDDPAPDDPANTKWKLITGGGTNAGGGGGVGTYQQLFTGSVDQTGETFKITDLVDNEVIDLIIRGSVAKSRVNLPAGFVDLASGDAVTRFNVAATGAGANMQQSVIWTGDGTSATLTALSRETTDATVTVAVTRAEHATPFTPTPENIFPAAEAIVVADDGVTITPDVAKAKLAVGLDLTQDLAYPAVSKMPQAGNNVKITLDDTGKRWVTDVRLPDEAAPRVYALDSRDVRQVSPPYSYSITSEGWTLTPGTRTMEPGPVSTHGYDSSHPGFDRDATNSSNNFNGTEFTLKNAGTTVRTIAMSTEITPANERLYSSAERLTMRVYVGGYFKTKSAPDGQVIYTKTWEFTGGYQDAFHFDWSLTLSQRGRSGEHDWWRCDYEWVTGSGEVVQGQIQAAKHTPSLPALGSVPKQAFGHKGAQDLDEIGDWIPPELKSQIVAASRVATFKVTAPDNTGTNEPHESDKADVLLPTVDNTTPFLRAAQDLSRLKLHFAGNAQSGAGDVYLCTRIQGFPPSVLANAAAASAWTIDYTAQGVMALQDFYLLDVKGSGMGAPTATWDANPGGPKINNVIDGIFHTAHLVAGINFTPAVTQELSIDDADLTIAAEAGLLHVIRIYSDNAVAEMPLRGIPRPVPFGSGSDKRRQIGPGWVKADAAAAAGNSTIIWVNPYRDIHGLHFAIQGTSGADQECYVSGAEIEYAKYDR